jgi:hypothetical protein
LIDGYLFKHSHPGRWPPRANIARPLANPKNYGSPNIGELNYREALASIE